MFFTQLLHTEILGKFLNESFGLSYYTQFKRR